MENIVNFFTLMYSAPIAVYSVPFAIFLVLLFLSVFGLNIDFNMDGEADFDSSFVKGFFTHFKATRIPFNLFVILFFMQGSIFTTIFADVFTQDTLYVSIFMFLIIYPILWTSVIPLSKMGYVLDNTIEHHKVIYVGSYAKVASVEVTATSGYANCDKNGVKNEIDVYSENESNGINRGDKVLITYFNEETKRYLVEKNLT